MAGEARRGENAKNNCYQIVGMDYSGIWLRRCLGVSHAISKIASFHPLPSKGKTNYLLNSAHLKKNCCAKMRQPIIKFYLF